MIPLEKMLSQVAKQTGLNKYQVTDVFKSQFDLVAVEMEKRIGSWVRIPYIGVFRDSKFKRELLTKDKDGKDRTH